MDLQALIPAGRMAVSAKQFVHPTPAFGPGSVEYIRRQAEELEFGADVAPGTQPVGAYAGAGSYF